MKLLICTQAVDIHDPVLGFFHRWIIAIASQCEEVTVICLREGQHALPRNVRVLSLGKECGRSRTSYLLTFLRYIWRERAQYSTVLVHMNEEYVLMGGFFWKLLGKNIWMWRNHKKGTVLTCMAVALSDRVFCTSRASFTARFHANEIMPVGIDTEVFSPSECIPEPRTLLFFGRLDPVKQVAEFVDALTRLNADLVEFKATICGDPTPGNEAYAEVVREQGKELVSRGKLTFLSAVPNSEAPSLYRRHALYVNLTPSGSFDKTILEAGACGALPVIANDVLDEVIPEELRIRESPVGALVSALILDSATRAQLSENVRVFVEREHSLKLLVSRILRTPV